MTMIWTQNIDWSNEPLYKEIAKTLIEAIKSGEITSSSKLPTHRELARKLGVAIGTVTKAYSEVEKNGLIHGNSRRGTVVGKPSTGKEALCSLMSSSKQTIDFSINFPPLIYEKQIKWAFKTLPDTQDFSKILKYHSPEGIIQHKEAGKIWMKTAGIETERDSIIPIGGAQQGISLVLSAITEPGDTIVAENITYPGIKAVADILKLKLRGLPMDKEGILPEPFEDICQRKKISALYSIPTIQNPTTSILSTDRRKSISEIACKYGVPILEDDIYRVMVKNPPPAFSQLNPDNTYTIVSVSKILAGGLRVGFLKAPENKMTTLLQTLQAQVWNVSFIGFEIFSILLKEGIIDKILNQRRENAFKRNSFAKNCFKQHNPLIHPFSNFMYLPLPDYWTPAQFCLEAQNQGILLSPAETFAINKTDIPNGVRVCHATPPDEGSMEKGLKKIRDIIESRPEKFSIVL